MGFVDVCRFATTKKCWGTAVNRTVSAQSDAQSTTLTKGNGPNDWENAARAVTALRGAGSFSYGCRQLH